MHVDDIHRTLKQLFQKMLETNNDVNARFHFHTYIHIAILRLLTP